jgi:hypothetical protein
MSALGDHVDMKEPGFVDAMYDAQSPWNKDVPAREMSASMCRDRFEQWQIRQRQLEAERVRLDEIEHGRILKAKAERERDAEAQRANALIGPARAVGRALVEDPAAVGPGLAEFMRSHLAGQKPELAGLVLNMTSAFVTMLGAAVQALQAKRGK